MSAGAEKKMVKTTIDGREHEFAEGTTILEAARSVGIQIPHYCYHPGLSIAGACRMCLVEIEKIPKLQISCYMTVGDGMVVYTDNERVKRARKAMMEFHLVNHPVDCPVCDQAGECGLQEYYMMHGLYHSRLRENKVRKARKAFRIGPYVMLDQERCILCSRCVRFCREISKSHELGLFKRGDRSVIDIFGDRELDNPYSVNVVDICPVGALTEREFRFKTRVWYLESADSVCPRCSRGCNVFIHYNVKRPWKNEGRKVLRLKPRFNEDVNRWWLCDEGRYCFRFIDDPDRLTEPSVRRDGHRETASWEDALAYAAERLTAASGESGKEVVALISPQAANEELHLLKKVFDERLPGWRAAFTTATRFPETEDDLLRRADKNPNTTGARLIVLNDMATMDLAELKKTALDGKIGALVVSGNDLTALRDGLGDGWDEALDKIGFLLYMGTNDDSTARKARVSLPVAAFAEREGTVANFEGRVQIQRRAFDPTGDSLPGWEIIRRLGVALGGEYAYASAEEVFLDLASSNEAFRGLDYAKIGPSGLKLNLAQSLFPDS